MSAQQETPLMRQYNEVKSRHQDAFLFFRMGDFYELFGTDAVRAAPILEVALTARNKNDENAIAMCGVPHHAVQHYIQKLVSQGHKVALCEQLESPTETKGIVRRDVVRIISPGTRFDLEALDSHSDQNTFAVTFKHVASSELLWASCDYTTGKFIFGTANDQNHFLTLLTKLTCSELIIPDNELSDKIYQTVSKSKPDLFIQKVPAFYFDALYAQDRIKEQFKVTSLHAIHPKLSDTPGPTGALIKHFQESLKTLELPTVTRIEPYAAEECMKLDPSTIRALDLLSSPNATRDVSLLKYLDQTCTAMGGRLLKSWIVHPLLSLQKIEERHQVVEIFQNELSELKDNLKNIYDLERLLTRVTLSKGALTSARDLQALSKSLFQVHQLKDFIDTIPHTKRLRELILGLTLPEALRTLVDQCHQILIDLPPPTPREGGMFKKGFSAELDELIDLCEHGETWLTTYEAQEREKTGISSLKVKFNRVFGYYIEITKSNLKSVPNHYIRKQTMVSGERYFTEELKQFEEKILTSEKKRHELEYELFLQLCNQFNQFSHAIHFIARSIAEIDVLRAFAEIAKNRQWTKPSLIENKELHIQQSWHPILSDIVHPSSVFVRNDIKLTSEKPFMIITGPNMGGKSTIMRQVALLSLLAQCGSFVPAEAATLGIVDQIFTRIGAQDNLSEGSSTFMVEMSEMSFILRNASEKSLILIDEIGRGTSTFDGLSLAWSIAQNLSEHIGARTLFATHYHELTQLAETVTGICNARVAVSVDPKSLTKPIEFLYKLEPGEVEHSYGILVAKKAGLPDLVLEHAELKLKELEQTAHLAKQYTSQKKPLSIRKKGIATLLKPSEKKQANLVSNPLQQIELTF